MENKEKLVTRYCKENQVQKVIQVAIGWAETLGLIHEMVEGDLHIRESEDIPKKEFYIAIEKQRQDAYCIMQWGKAQTEEIAQCIQEIQDYTVEEFGFNMQTDYF